MGYTISLPPLVSRITGRFQHAKPGGPPCAPPPPEHDSEDLDFLSMSRMQAVPHCRSEDLDSLSLCRIDPFVPEMSDWLCAVSLEQSESENG
jgi:hypothetical protein